MTHGKNNDDPADNWPAHKVHCFRCGWGWGVISGAAYDVNKPCPGCGVEGLFCALPAGHPGEHYGQHTRGTKPKPMERYTISSGLVGVAAGAEATTILTPKLDGRLMRLGVPEHLGACFEVRGFKIGKLDLFEERVFLEPFTADCWPIGGLEFHQPFRVYREQEITLDVLNVSDEPTSWTITADLEGDDRPASRDLPAVDFAGMPIPLQGSCDCPKCGHNIKPIIEFLFFKVADVCCPDCGEKFSVGDTDLLKLDVNPKGLTR